MTHIGVFGGAFDPPHVGHLVVAQDVSDALELDLLLFVPTAHPPHRHTGPYVHGEGRVAMVRAAIEGDPRFEVWTGEFDRPGPSYTVDTLRVLRDQYPDGVLHLVLGADQFARLDTWRDPETIAELCRIVVVGRDGDDGGAPRHGIIGDTVAVPRLEISSSGIRARVREGRSIRYLVPGPVSRIIEEQGWYKNG